MPAKKHGTTWDAAPHTVAKIRILQSYLYVYFQILGQSSQGANILYLDGFAGPGRYENFSDGSPVAALKAAVAARRDAVQRGTWKAGAIHLAFIEADRKRFEHLEKVIAEVAAPLHLQRDEVQYKVIRGEFSEQVSSVKAWCPRPFHSKEPLFAFVDPFGAKGVPLEIVRELLTSSCSEMLFNLNAFAVARVLKAKEAANHEQVLDGIFGNSGSSWRDVLDPAQGMESLCRDVLALYKERLHDIGMKYVFSFEMRKTEAALDYFLVFASHHRLGLIRMKEAMRELDRDGSYKFVDTMARSGQGTLFRFDNPEDFTRPLFETFKGQSLGYETLWDWALLHSPFTNPKEMLVALEKLGRIRAHVKAGAKRRRGSFPEEKIQSVEFASSWQVLFKPET